MSCRSCGGERPLISAVRNKKTRSLMLNLSCCGLQRHIVLPEDLLWESRDGFLEWSPGDPRSWRDLDGNMHAVDVRIGPHFFTRCNVPTQRALHSDDALADGSITCVACLGALS